MTGINEMIAVMRHFAEGGEVEIYDSYMGKWELVSEPIWNWKHYEYRIKPKAKRKIKLEAWLDSAGVGVHLGPDHVIDTSRWTRLPALDLETEVG